MKKVIYFVLLISLSGYSLSGSNTFEKVKSNPDTNNHQAYWANKVSVAPNYAEILLLNFEEVRVVRNNVLSNSPNFNPKYYSQALFSSSCEVKFNLQKQLLIPFRKVDIGFLFHSHW